MALFFTKQSHYLWKQQQLTVFLLYDTLAVKKFLLFYGEYSMDKFFLALFFISSILHLWESWNDNALGRARTKSFPILMLALAYIFFPGTPSPILLTALITSWLGDVLLIPKGNKWFIIGGSSFLVSHFLFMAVYLPHIHFSRIPWLILLPAAALYASVSIAVIRAIRDNTPRIMAVSMWLYLLTNSSMNLFALMQLLTDRQPGEIAAFAGALLFFFSDCILFLVRFHRNPALVPRRHFPVMLCYLSGEFLITLGMGMLAK